MIIQDGWVGREQKNSSGLKIKNMSKQIPNNSQISDTFDPLRWQPVLEVGDLSDLTCHRAISYQQPVGNYYFAPPAQIQSGQAGAGPATYQADQLPAGTDLGVVRIAFDRPQVRNAFRPHTVDELLTCLEYARCQGDIRAVIITGNGPAADGGYAFCSGGDQRIRDRDGYRYEHENTDPNAQLETRRQQIDQARNGRLHILEVQRLIRLMPKPVIAALPGWAAGGGHSLMVVCDLAVASREHARFKQTDANVGSFDAGYGSALLARQCGDKRAREIFFLAQTYSAEQAQQWGVINAAVAHCELETTALEWALTIAQKSPQAIRMLKYAFNLPDEGIHGQQLFAGEATRLAYRTDEAEEGRKAFLEHRVPDWSAYPQYF